jgi:hypothetical protein
VETDRETDRQVVACWEREFVKADMPRRLAFIYLANHIMQESRKKGPEFVTQFTVRASPTTRSFCRPSCVIRGVGGV